MRITKSPAIVFILLNLFLVSGCATFSGYSSLPYEEKMQYQALADTMSIEQRMHYLELKDATARSNYLREIGVVRSEKAVRVADRLPVQDKPIVKALQHNPAPTDASLMAREIAPEPVAPPVAIPSTAPTTIRAGIPANDTDPNAPLVYERPNRSAPAPVAVIPPATEVEKNIAEKNVVEKSVSVPTEPKRPEIAAVRPPEKTSKTKVEIEPPSTSNREVAEVLPRVKYTKTGDPVTDVLTLLDLFEKGKISKSQFENEKALALQTIP